MHGRLHQLVCFSASLGDPTRANGVNRTQWRTFCKASRLSEHLTTAKVDLLFTAALKINEEESGSGLDKIRFDVPTIWFSTKSG